MVTTGGERSGAIYVIGVAAHRAISAGRVGGRRVLSTAKREHTQEPAPVFISTTELRSLARVDVRVWVGELDDIRIGVGSIGGRVSTLLRLGDGARPTDPALVCELESGETVLLEGGAVAHAGRVPATRHGVLWDEKEASILDVNALYRWVEASVWERSALRTSDAASSSRERG